MEIQKVNLLTDRVLSKLPPHENIALHEQAIARTLRKGEYLCHQGDIWPYCVYLVSGEFTWTMLSSGGKEHVLFNLDPGEFFWAHSLFDDLAMPAALIAAKNSEVQLWDRSRILEVSRASINIRNINALENISHDH